MTDKITFFSDKPRKPRRTDLLTVLHHIAFIFGILITVDYLVTCCCSILDAIDSFQFYKAFDEPYSFAHCLNENSFASKLRMFLVVFFEFLLFVLLYRRMKINKNLPVSISCFSAILVLHTIIWLHASSLDFPESPPYITADGIGFDYYIFAVASMCASAAYLITYLLKIRSLRSK